MRTKHFSQKLYQGAGIAYIGLFILFVIAKALFPDAGGGWSDPPIIDYLFLLGFSICITIIGSIGTYYSWKLNAKTFVKWSSQMTNPKWAVTWGKLSSDSSKLWAARLIAPFIALIGIGLIGFMFVNIINYFIG